MTLSVQRSDLQEFAIRSLGAGAVSDVAIARVNAGIENALDMLSMERRFSFMQNTYDIITVPDVTFSSISISDGGTSVTDADSSIPDTVGAYFEFNGERHWYEMTARASAAAATIRQPYSSEDASDLSSVSGKLLYPLNALPGNFNKITGLLDVSNGQPLYEMAYDAAWLSKLERVGQGTPEAFGIVADNHDPNAWYLYLWPAPDTQKRYVMTYFRMLGWYDTATVATNTWKRKATADTDYVDWPDKMLYVLEAAVLASVAREIRPDAQMSYLNAFNMAVMQAAGMDKKSSKPMRLSMGGAGLYGTRYEFPQG